MTATMFFDGQHVEVKYGPGEEFECPEDFFTPCSSEWRGPYEGLLGVLASHPWFSSSVLLDSQGILRVGLPFCGSIQEFPVLASFLAERFLGRPDVRGVHVLGSDIDNWNLKGGYWRQKEKYAERKYPGMQVRFSQLDLSRQPHPRCGLTLGMHPECTVRTDLWRLILSNVIRATVGVCMLATFKEGEMEVVADVCANLGVQHEVHRNPYWQSTPLPAGTVPPFLQFLILIRCSA